MNRLALIACAWLALVPAAAAQSAGSVTSWSEIPFSRVVRQFYDFSCGSAALASLLDYHFNAPASEAEVFEAMYAAGDQAKIRQNGFSLLDMQNYLRARGFETEGRRIDADTLFALTEPAITLITTNGYRHFVLIKGVHRNRILIGDPAQGARVMDRKQFEAIWNNVVFIVRKPGARAIFNAPDDWAVRPMFTDYTGWDRSIDSIARDLAPLYQISAQNAGSAP